MTAFDVAIKSLFADPNLIIRATYYPLRGSEQKVSVVVHKPDDFHTIGDSIIASPTLALDVALSACPNIEPGEKFVIDGKSFIVQGEVKKDSANLTARVSLCAA